MKIGYTLLLSGLFISNFMFGQTGLFGTVTATNSRGSAPSIALTSPNTCSDIGSLKSGRIQIRNLSGATSGDFINSQSCFTIPTLSSYKNVWVEVTIPPGSGIEGLYFYSSTSGVSPQPSSGTNLRTAYIQVYDGGTCVSGLNCGGTWDNVITDTWSSAPYIRSVGTTRVDVVQGKTYRVEISTSTFSTDPNYNFDVLVVPLGPAPSNANCSNAIPFTNQIACNLGSYPGCNSDIPNCAWTIENSVYYSFVKPVNGAFDITITNVQCEGGGNDLQSAIYLASTANCNSQLNTSGNQLDDQCFTGSYTYTLNNSDPVGTEYIIWFDGNAGAACTWGVEVTVPCNPPSISLSSSTGSTCVGAPITVSGNTFGGSATNVVVTEDGAGSITPSSSGSSPFAFTYTPSPGDAGNSVTITVTSDNPNGSPCVPAVETYVLDVLSSPDPTLSTNSTDVCEADGLVDLTAFEAGTTGGTWSGTGVSGTDFDPSSGTQTLTYTVGVSPCDDSETITINVTPDVDPSLTTTATSICASSGVLDLTAFEAGTTGGTWSGVGVTGTDFDPASGNQTLTYTVGTAPCEESQDLVVTVVTVPDPTLSTNSTDVCEADGLVDLTAFEAGTTGGTWSGTGVSGTDFDPSSGTQTLTYTVGTAPCDNSETITINVTPDVDPSLSTTTTSTCATSGLLDLTAFEAVTTGGTWSGVGVTGTDFDPSSGNQTLTYTVGTAPCEEIENLTVTVVTVPDPTLSTNSIDVCEADGLVDLTTFEAGTTGGTWSGVGVSGTDFDPSSGTQTLTYTVGVSPCDDSETITINVTPDVDPSLTTTATSICASSGVLDLTAFEAGTTGGTWSGVGVTGTDFDPTSGNQTLTYTVGTAPCEESQDLVVTVVTVPDPTLSTNSTDVCEADGLVDLTTFEAGTTGGTWSGVGVSGTDFDPSSGTQTLTYTVGVLPCDDSETITINVTPDVDPSLSTTTTSICATSGLLDLTAFEAGTTGGTWSGVGVTGTDFDPSSGNQTLTYTVGTAPCEESQDLVVTVVTVPDPTLSNNSIDVCEADGLVDLSAFEAGTTGGTWSGVGVSGTDFDPSSGTQNLTYTVGASPCLDTDMIMINVIPSADASLTDDTLSVCDDIGLINLTTYEGGTSGGSWSGIGVSGSDYDPTSGSNWVTYLVGTSPCEASDSIYFEVTTVPSAPVAIDTLVCITDSSVVLTAQGGMGEIIWYSDSLLQQPIDTGSIITYPYNTTGLNEIYLQETLNGCYGDTGVVSVDVGSITVGIITDPAITTGETPFEIEFDGYDSSIDTYTWYIGDGTIYTDSIIVHTFTNSGEYSNILVGSNDYCTASDTIIITVTEGDSWFVIPNVFTPNFDEENDIFRVSGTGLEIVKGQIYNRWGQLMYKWDTVQGGWDGRTTAGEEASEGTYYYIIEIKTLTMGEKETFTGPLQLIR